MITPPPPRYVFVCNVCRSDRVTRDAWTIWDADAQQWVLGAVYDHAYCHRCENDTHLEDVILNGPGS
jgi:hypothetical protein